MDPQTPRSLGEIEDSEPAKRAPGRTSPVKKSLDQFLVEFEERLLNHPDEPATSASAALLGRAEGVWRTPIEGAERQGRRIPRRIPPRAEQAAPVVNSAAAAPLPPASVRVEVPEIVTAEIPVAELASPPAAVPKDAPPPGDSDGENVAAPAVGTTDTAEAPSSRRRNRRHRRHRRR